MTSIPDEGGWQSGTGRLEHVAVVGGGRWARVLSRLLTVLVPAGVGVSVHSSRNAGGMADWVWQEGLQGLVTVTAEPPLYGDGRARAVIVANAARDHAASVEQALSAGVPVLVEKPVALTAAAAEALAGLANASGVRFGAAQVFLFAGYIQRFARLAARSGPVSRVRFRWADATVEERYGETKLYDPTLPVIADWMPHAVPILEMVTSSTATACSVTSVRRGGAAVELSVLLGTVPCAVEFERDAAQRDRLLEVTTENGVLNLDFAEEPGLVTVSGRTQAAARDWGRRQSPATQMLTAFLAWASGGKADSRLDIGTAVRSSRLVDQLLADYRAKVAGWLANELASLDGNEEDIRYAVREFLLLEHPMNINADREVLEREVGSAVARLRAMANGRVLRGTERSVRQSIQHVLGGLRLDVERRVSPLPRMADYRGS